jgi:hypothetical protein
MVGVPEIFTGIVTIKDRQWFWSKPIIASLEDTVTNSGTQVRKIRFLYIDIPIRLSYCIF